jgi:hypothetical protein
MSFEYNTASGSAISLEGEAGPFEIALQEDEFTIGALTPVAGPGIRVGANFEGGGIERFLTPRGYLRAIGLAWFSREYPSQGAQLESWSVNEGHWSQYDAVWISGMKVMRTVLGPYFRNLPYREVP